MMVNYKKASTYYLIGNIFNKGLSFLVVPVFTRIISTYDYGVVTTYNSWVAICSIIIGFALHMGIRSAFIDYSGKIDDFMSVTTSFTIASGIVLGSLILVISTFLLDDYSVLIVSLCIVHGLSSALIEDYSMYLMMKYKYRTRTALMILPNLLATIASILVIVYMNHKNRLYWGRIVPTVIVYFLFGIVVCLLIYRRSRMIYNYEYIKYALTISTPLIFHGTSLVVLAQSDRTMITWLRGASQTGIYSLIYNFGMLSLVLSASLEGVWVPWFVNMYRDERIEDINTRVVDYVHIMTYSMVGLILVGPEVVRLLASFRYWEGITIIPPIVIANYVVFLYTLYVNIEHFHKRTSIITINTLIAAFINILLNYLFIPTFGYVAAAYTTLFAYTAALFLHAVSAKRLAKELFPIRMFFPSLVHLIIATCIFYSFLNCIWVRWILTSGYIALVICINRKKIKELFARD